MSLSFSAPLSFDVYITRGNTDGMTLLTCEIVSDCDRNITTWRCITFRLP